MQSTPASHFNISCIWHKRSIFTEWRQWNLKWFFHITRLKRKICYFLSCFYLFLYFHWRLQRSGELCRIPCWVFIYSSTLASTCFYWSGILSFLSEIEYLSGRNDGYFFFFVLCGGRLLKNTWYSCHTTSLLWGISLHLCSEIYNVIFVDKWKGFGFIFRLLQKNT